MKRNNLFRFSIPRFPLLFFNIIVALFPYLEGPRCARPHYTRHYVKEKINSPLNFYRLNVITRVMLFQFVSLGARSNFLQRKIPGVEGAGVRATNIKRSYLYPDDFDWVI